MALYVPKLPPTGEVIMSRNDDKSLEWLVSLIEEQGVPRGFGVNTRKPVFEDGVQIAELDIVVTGKVGTTTFKGLIELTAEDVCGCLPIYSPLLIRDATQLVGVRFFLKSALDPPVRERTCGRGFERMAKCGRRNPTLATAYLLGLLTVQIGGPGCTA
jgi:hypothetical protein